MLDFARSATGVYEVCPRCSRSHITYNDSARDFLTTLGFTPEEISGISADLIASCPPPPDSARPEAPAAPEESPVDRRRRLTRERVRRHRSPAR